MAEFVNEKTALEAVFPSSAKAGHDLRPVFFVDIATIEEYGDILRRLFVGLANKSYPCYLVIPPQASVGPIISPAVTLVRYPIYQLPFLARQNRRALIERLEKFKPNILHCLCASKESLTRQIAKDMDIPYVMSFFDDLNRMVRPGFSAGHCYRLLAGSSRTCEHLEKLYPRYAERIERVNPGVFVEDETACYRNDEHVPSLLVLHSLDSIKSFAVLLQAVKHLAIDGYEFILAIMGRGHAEKKLHKLIHTLGLDQVVTVVPEMRPLRDIFRGTDIYIQLEPGRKDATHLLEAQAVGMAIAAAEPFASEALCDHETAVLFDADDELNIYGKIKYLFDSREQARKIAAAGQEYLRAHHTVSNMTERLIDTYLKALAWYRMQTAPAEQEDE